MLNRQADVLTQECVTLLVTLKSCPLQIRRDNFYFRQPASRPRIGRAEEPEQFCFMHSSP